MNISKKIKLLGEIFEGEVELLIQTKKGIPQVVGCFPFVQSKTHSDEEDEPEESNSSLIINRKKLSLDSRMFR